MAMTVTPEKVNIPAPGDPYGYLSEQRSMAASQRTIVQVADRAEGDVIAAAMAADGRAVSDTNPLYIYRTDFQRVEAKTSGGWGGPPQGLQAMAEYKTVSGAIAAKAVVMNLPTFTFIGGRSYRIELEGNWYVSSSASTFVAVVGTCATSDAASSTANITTLISLADNPNAAMEGRRLKGSTVYRPATTATLQVKFTFERATGSANGFIQGSSTEPFQLRIWDEGIIPVVVQS